MSSLAPTTSLRPQPRPSAISTTSYRSDSNGRVSIIQKPLSFDIECSGLKPNTKHDFYYQNEKYTDYCKSTMQDLNVGSSVLQTDSTGTVRFKFQLPVKFVIDNSVTSISIEAGDKLFELRAVNSSAKVKVPFKNF